MDFPSRHGKNYAYGTIRPHAVRSANGTWFTYDMNGNAVFRSKQRLDYDVNNHLYRVVNTNGTTATFGYDASGARLWEQAGTNALQVWIGGNYEEKGGQILYHIYAGGRQVATFDKTGTNVFQYYHPDDLTSTSIQTDQNGSEIQNFTYTAFGQNRYTQNTNAFKVSRRYTGQVLDDSTGLYYYNARYYDPVLGRFTQPDDVIPSIFEPQSYNRYSYCVNNPLRYTDPTGHDLAEVFDSAYNFGGGVLIGGMQVLSPVPAQLQNIPSASTTAEANGRSFGASIAVSISTAETLFGGTIAAGGGTVEFATAGLASPVALPAVGVGGAMAAHGVNGINNYAHMNRSVTPAKPVDASRPVHGSSAHDDAAREIVNNWKKQTDTKEARFNQELVGPDGKTLSNLRPDAQRIRTDGKIDITEVQSKTQSAKFMNDKIQTYKNILGDKAGNVAWVRSPDK